MNFTMLSKSNTLRRDAEVKVKEIEILDSQIAEMRESIKKALM